MTGEVNYEVHCEIVRKAIDNPPVNQLSSGVCHGLASGFDKALADDAVEATVLTGAGRAFIAGADI